MSADPKPVSVRLERCGETFADGTRALEPLDLEIKDRRDGYNAAVREYNAAIARVPANIVALVGAFPRLRPLDFERAGP